MGNATLLPEELLYQHADIAELATKEIWTISRHPITLHLWGAINPYGQKHDSAELQHHLEDCHPLMMIFKNGISDNIFQNETIKESLL